MKTKFYLITIALIFFMTSCSKNDDDGGTVATTIESFDPVEIEFVYEDGSSIAANECLSPDDKYAIQIEVEQNNEGNTTVSQIQYTINGFLYSMSFSEAGMKQNPINLVDGKNLAQLVKTAETSELTFVVQDDFVLVE